MSKDCKVGSTQYFYFTSTVDGVPTALGGSPTVAVYRSGNSIVSTTVATLTQNVDGLVGFNRVVIDFTGDSGFFSAGQDFAIITSTGTTLNSVSVSGVVWDTFTIEKHPVNWAQVTAPTTTVALTNTTIATVSANVILINAAAPSAFTMSANVVQWRTSTPNTLTSGRVDSNVANSTLAAESYAADGAEPTLSEMLYMLLSMFGQFAITTTTISCKKLDGTTESMAYGMDNTADVATSRTRIS